jgi:hypothetical protein
MIYAESLHQAVAEIAEEMPNFGSIKRETWQSLREPVSIMSKKELGANWLRQRQPGLHRPHWSL